MSKLIEMGKAYTSNGRPVRILCVDRSHTLPVAALVVGADGQEYIEEFTASGSYQPDGSESAQDLKEVKPRRTGWVNVYPTGCTFDTGWMHHTKKQADEWHNKDHTICTGRIACIEVSFTEGDGL